MGKPLSCFEDFQRQVLHTLPWTLILVSKHFLPGSPSSCLIQAPHGMNFFYPCRSSWKLFPPFPLSGSGATSDLVKVLTMHKSQSPFSLGFLLCKLRPGCSEDKKQDPVCGKVHHVQLGKGCHFFFFLPVWNGGDGTQGSAHARQDLCH